jgi:hypothetical protein
MFSSINLLKLYKSVFKCDRGVSPTTKKKRIARHGLSIMPSFYALIQRRRYGLKLLETM